MSQETAEAPLPFEGGRLTLNNRARITAKTRGAGQAGAITVTAPTVDITSGGTNFNLK